MIAKTSSTSLVWGRQEIVQEKSLGTRQDVVGKPTGRSFRNKRKNINLENCEDKNKNTEDTRKKDQFDNTYPFL